MNVFEFDSYKAFLKSYISQNEVRGVITHLAAACGCDRTYISQVLNGKVDLTPDHMVQLCSDLNLSDLDSKYLLLLLLRDRSTSAKARAKLSQKVAALRGEAMMVSKIVLAKEQPSEIPEDWRTRYYSHWHYGAAHILTSVESTQTAAAIAQKLNIPLANATRILQELAEMGVVEHDRGRYTHKGSDIYLPRDCPQSYSHHLGWRMRAVERTMDREDIHYTLAFSVSRKDVDRLRLQILELVEKQRSIVRQSGAESACVFCVDFLVL